MNKKTVRFILLCLAAVIVALSSIAILASCGNLITTILNNSKSTSTAPAPSFSLKAGLYTSTQSLSISSSLEGSTIRFTVDGSDPSSSHGTVYSAPISVSSSVTVKARSFKPNWEDSPIASAVFTITGTVPVPTFTVDTGTYSSAQNVTITCSDSAATIRYTVDGSTPSVSHGTVYSTPVSIASSQTLKAVAYRTNWTTSASKTAVYTITGTLSPPVFSPVEGVYTSSPQMVSISSPDSGVTIKYTTDGTTVPDSTHGTPYTSPISVNATQTIKAVAFKTSWSDSGVSSATFTITGTEPTPILGLSAGTYATTQSLTITCSDTSATIRYTTDGSTPSATNGQNYSTALSIVTSQTIKAVAVKQDWADSRVASAVYTITGTVAAPTFGIDANTYQSAQSVSLNCTTSGATIYYTIDGTTPTSASSVYGTALSVFKNETIKAFAHLNSWTDSSVASANYIIQYTVAFNSQGGTSVASVTGLSYNATISAPTAPTRTGYAFGGWFTDSACTSPWTFATSQVTTNTTLYAKWSPTYQVTYNSNGSTSGSVPTDTTNYLGNATVTVWGNPNSLAKTGYTFSGWNTLSTGFGSRYLSGATFTLNNANVTLYAQWTLADLSSAHVGTLVGVPAGTYHDDGNLNSNNTSSVSSFRIGKYEITQTQFKAITGYNPSAFTSNGTTKPVDQVSWYAAVKFCNLLSMAESLTPAYKIKGSTNPASWGTLPTARDASWDAATIDWSSNGYRLPTEAEWRWAGMGAQDAVSSKAFAGLSGTTIGANAWYKTNANDVGTGSPNYGTNPVGTKQANELGLYDMSGNVWEWVWDWYGSLPAGALTNYTGPSTGTSRMYIGGSWYDAANLLNFNRFTYNWDPSAGAITQGLRVVRK